MKNKKNRYIIYGVILIICFVLLLITFGNRGTLKCTMETDQTKNNGYKLKTEYLIKSKKKIVTTVTIKEEISSNNNELLSKYEKQLNDQYEYNKKNFGGYSYKVVKTKKQVKTNVKIDYKKFDLEKFTKTNEAMDKFTVDGELTLDGAKRLYESTGAVCK